MNSTERFFLSRYIRDPKRNLLKFSFVFMVLGIVLSVAILSAGMNLFEGYERALKSVLFDSFAHIKVQSSGGEYLSPEQLAHARSVLEQQPEVASLTPLVSFNVMALQDEQMRGCLINAYDTASQAELPFEKFVIQGEKRVHDSEIIIGHYLAKEYKLSIGDTLRVMYPQLDRITPLGLYSGEHAFRIAGLYRSGFYEYDRSLIICSIPTAWNILFTEDKYAALDVRLKSHLVENAPSISRKYDVILGSGFTAVPMVGGTLLRTVAMQKWLIFIVFSFLVMIAGINVISAVSTQIYDKRNEIAVLKTLGAAPQTIRRVIQYQLFLVCVAAILIGQGFGALLSWMVVKQNFYRLKGEVYFIDKLELYISAPNMLAVFVVAAIFCVICIVLPLRKIDKLHIIDLLRNP